MSKLIRQLTAVQLAQPLCPGCLYKKGTATMTKPLSIFRSNWQLYRPRKQKLRSPVVFLLLWHRTHLKPGKTDSTSQGQQFLCECFAIVIRKRKREGGVGLFPSSKHLMSSKEAPKVKHICNAKPSAVLAHDLASLQMYFYFFRHVYVFPKSFKFPPINKLRINIELGKLICKVYWTKKNTDMLFSYYITHTHICFTWHPPRQHT